MSYRLRNVRNGVALFLNLITQQSRSLIAILYVVISDWLQLGIDIAVTKARELRKIQAYKSQSKLVQAEYKSTKEYAAKLIDLGLENWLEDKNKLEHECDEAKNKYEVIQSEYDEIRKQLSFMSAEYKNKTRELRDQQRLAKDLLESTHKLGKYLEKFENDEMSSLAGLKASSDRAELFAPVLKKAEYMNSILQSNQEQVIKQDRQSNVNGGVGTEAVSLE